MRAAEAKMNSINTLQALVCGCKYLSLDVATFAAANAFQKLLQPPTREIRTNIPQAVYQVPTSLSPKLHGNLFVPIVLAILEMRKSCADRQVTRDECDKSSTTPSSMAKEYYRESCSISI
jgi:hypothetical protein